MDLRALGVVAGLREFLETAAGSYAKKSQVYSAVLAGNLLRRTPLPLPGPEWPCYNHAREGCDTESERRA